MDVFDLVVIGCALVGGAGFAIYGLRLLRRGDEVTAEDGVNWRRRVKKMGINASPDMNPDITDILVRAWRSLRGWFAVGTGTGALFAGIGGVVYYALNLAQDDTSDAFYRSGTFGLVLVELVVLAVAVGGAIGLLVGFSCIKRDSHVDSEIVASRRLRDYRPIYVALYPLAVLIGEVVLMAVLMLRLAPELDSASLAHAFALPGMWIVPVAPAILFIAVVGVELLVRRTIALPPLSLPQDAEVRQLADKHMRRWGVFRSYWCFYAISTMTTGVQAIILDTSSFSYYPRYEVIVSPLIRTELDFWFGGFWILTMFGGMLLSSSLQPTTRNPTSLWGRSNSPTESVRGAE